MALHSGEERDHPASMRGPNDAHGIDGGRARHRHAANHRIVGMTCISASLATFVAATFPGPLVLPTLASLLTFAAVICVCVAYLAGHKLFAAHLTLWDKAAALFVLSLAASLHVDHAAAQAVLDARASASGLGS